MFGKNSSKKKASKSKKQNAAAREAAPLGKAASRSAVSRSERRKNKAYKKANRRNVWLLVLTTLLVVASVALFMPPQDKINQGLDLQGGLSVVLTATSTDGDEVTSDEMESSRDIIESRVNALGASEATVTLQGTDQILVQIPGLTDAQDALDTIGRTGTLEFARLDSFTDEDVADAIDSGEYIGEETVTDSLGYTFTIGEEELTNLEVEEGTYTPLVTGDQIESVTIDRESDTSSYYAVNITLDDEATEAFAEATEELAEDNGKIVIILDGIVQSAPSVQATISDGNVSITGDYSLEEAQELKTVLESGSLPVSFEYSQTQTVGPTLGQDALNSGVVVAAAGLLLVMLYLLLFYNGLGFITAAAMLVFAALYLGLLALLSYFDLFSLSLSGIAGIVLTIGMAADSSILVLERFREEIRTGRSVRAASLSGVKHGILTSIDADLVTLVSALTLFFLASASVKGFGLTLALGIVCDIVMMLIFKGPIIRLLAPGSIKRHPLVWGVRDCERAVPYYTGEKKLAVGEKLRGRFIKRDFDIIGKKRIFLTASAVVIVALLGAMCVRGISFGIEFVGGTSITFYGTGDTTTEELREAFDDAGTSDAVIQTTSSDDEVGFLVRTSITSAEDAAELAAQVADEFGWESDSYEVTTIGPGWGTNVIKSSLLAFAVSLLLIIVYISIRFRDYKMGITAIVALLHDLIIVFGLYALLGQEVTPNTVAALLTILGYSLYDTVVVFHRINENMKSEGVACTFSSMANHSINEVLLRSMNTSITSLIPVVAMLLFGGETLKDFALAMTIGLVCGCYSSLAVATPLYCMWKEREAKHARLVRKYGKDIYRFFLNKLEELPAGDTSADKSEGVQVQAGGVEESSADGVASGDNEDSAMQQPMTSGVDASQGESRQASVHKGSSGSNQRKSNYHYGGKNKK